MRANILKARWSGWRFLAVCLLSATLAAGCGMSVGTDGSGSVSTAGVGTGGTGVFKASLSGSATDGYLINAVVFLDKDSNYQLDSGEPFAATDVDGNSTLTVDSGDIGAYPVVALVIKGLTIDSSTMQPVTANYVLSFPKESINSSTSNFISPLSSQLRELMETGRYATVQQALDALAAQMGLPSGTNLLDGNNSTVQTASKTIAELMSKQMDRIIGSTQSVDVERYRTMMALIESNMTIISQMNTPENLANLSRSITVVLSGMPEQKAEVRKVVE